MALEGAVNIVLPSALGLALTLKEEEATEIRIQKDSMINNKSNFTYIAT